MKPPIWPLFLLATLARTCKIVPLRSRRSLLASEVFSADVKSLFIRRHFRKSPVAFAARVQIEEVFKGELRIGEEVVVAGLDAPHLCARKPRLAAKRLFFADPAEVTNADVPESLLRLASVKVLRLRSSLLRPTSRNLRFLRDLRGEARALFVHLLLFLTNGDTCGWKNALKGERVSFPSLVKTTLAPRNPTSR